LKRAHNRRNLSLSPRVEDVQKAAAQAEVAKKKSYLYELQKEIQMKKDM